MRTLRILAVAIVIAALLCSAGCGKKSAQAPTSKAPAGKTIVIGMSQCNGGEPWRAQMDKDIQDAADKNGIKLLLKDAQNNAATQQAQVREYTAQGVDLIIISPKETVPLTQPVAQAYDKGIPVIVLDRKVNGDKFTCFIGADNVKIGEEAGKYMVKLLGGKGNIVELKGLMTSQPGQDRHNGFMQGIKGSNIKIIFDADCKWQEPDAQREMNSALARFPQIDAVYAHNDPQAHGAYLAAKQEGKGREKTIKFIGIDALPHEGVRYVRDGVLSATFQYPTCGEQAIETAIKILNKQTVPKNITLGTKIFTKDTVAKGGEAL
jgi:ribose transport system substrate-binding protein